jgi:hypothetical protein
LWRDAVAPARERVRDRRAGLAAVARAWRLGAPAARRLGPDLATARRPVRMLDGEDEAGADGVVGAALEADDVLAGGVTPAPVSTAVTGVVSTSTFGSSTLGSASSLACSSGWSFFA